MKKKYLFYCLLFIAIFSSNFLVNAQNYPPIIINENDRDVATYGLGGALGGNVTIRLQREELTGKQFPLQVTLPGDLPINCKKKVTVIYDSVLEYVHVSNPYFPTGTENPKVSYDLVGNQAQAFALQFRFPGYHTCNNTTANITVKVEVECNGQVQTYQNQFQIKARAQNTWVFSGWKPHEESRIDCGNYYYGVKGEIKYPNGIGYGVYSGTGTITMQNTDGSTTTQSFNDPVANKDGISFYKTFSACRASVPANTQATYNFTLSGSNGCGENGISGNFSVENYIGTRINRIRTPPISLFVNVNANDGSTTIPVGGSGKITVRFCNTDPNVNESNITLNVPINTTLVNITSISDSDGNVYPIQPNGQYNFSFPRLGVTTDLECKSITFQFTTTNNYTGNEYIELCSKITYNVNVENTPPPICSECWRNPYQNSYTSQNCGSSTGNPPSEPPRPAFWVEKCIFYQQSEYKIGDEIWFKVLVQNLGETSGSINLIDELSGLQDITVVPASFGGYSYYDNVPETIGCNHPYPSSEQWIPTTFPASGQHNGNALNFQIDNMPNDPHKVLIFTYSAIINPQSPGEKINRVRNSALPEDYCYDDCGEVSYQVYEYGELSIEKRADVTMADVGDVFNYEIKVKNTGSMTLNQVVVTDALPACVEVFGTPTIENSNGTPIFFTTSGNLNFHITESNLEIGDTFKIIIPVKKVALGDCCNTASVVANVVLFNSNVTADSSPPSACVTSPPVPAIEVSKCLVEPKEYYQIGDQISFRILVKNTGDLEGNIRLLDELQNLNQNLTLVNTPSIKYFSSGDCQTLGNEIGVPNTFQFTENHSVASLDWTLSNIPFDAQKVFVIEYTATINPQEFGSKKNEVKNTDGEILDDVDYTVVGIPGVEITKTADRQYVEVGNNFNYIISIKNTGQTSLHNISVEDLLPTCVELSGTIVAKDKNENFVNFVQTTNVLLDFENYELLPNDILVISIPVKKATSGSCCNVATVKVECKITHEKISVSTNENSACIKEANSACSYEFSKLKRAVPDLFPQAVENELAVNFIHHIDKEYDDIDNDGDVDILYVKTGNLKVLINSAGASNPPVFPSVGIDVAIQYPNILDHTNFPNSAITVLSHRLFDWDNDGDKDLIILAGKPAGSGKFLSGIYLYLNGGTGNFSMPVTLLDATRQGDYYGYHPSNAFPADYYQFIEVGDLNNDGLPDLLISGKDRIYGTVYFENTGTIVNPSFSLVSPQQFIPNATFQFWSQNPAFPRPTGSHQVPELHSIYGGGLDVFISNPLVEQNAQYGGGRLYYHPNLGGQTSGVLPNFNYTGFTNQFGLNDDWSSNYPNADFPNENSSPLLCDWIVTRFTDYFGTGCPIVIVYNNCTKKFYYYDQETPTLQMNDYNASRFIVDLYPNPAKHEVFYQISKNLMLKDIKIFDASGKLIAKPNIKQNRIDTANLPSGIYYVHFITDQKIITKKLIVK